LHVPRILLSGECADHCQLAERLRIELLSLGGAWVTNMDLRLSEGTSVAPARTRVLAGLGRPPATRTFYYRVYSTVILIEYDQQAAGPR
jgi:hypothetical protein